MVKYPKIYLGADNCFMIKRWVEPETWIPVLKEMGINYAECTFDNEIDFFYSPQWYINDWFDRVAKVEKEYDFKVKAYYSGYQTYRTAGLAHPDPRMADNMVDNFFLPVLKKIEGNNCSVGFSIHTYPEDVLQDPEKFKIAEKQVWDRYGRIVEYSKNHGNTPICVEQMYTPAQSPWTIQSNIDFIKYVYEKNGGPVYTTVDVGHVIGQRKHQKPSDDQLRENLENKVQISDLTIWLGGNSTYELWDKIVNTNDSTDNKLVAIKQELEKYPYLFSLTEDDYNPYRWLEELAPYSPIVHMQQTDGYSAPHAPFSTENNDKGIVKGPELLKAIKESFDRIDGKNAEGMPPVTEEIFLNFEIFASSTMSSRDAFNMMKETVDYWRKYIPEDGLTIDELVSKL